MQREISRLLRIISDRSISVSLISLLIPFSGVCTRQVLRMMMKRVIRWSGTGLIPQPSKGGAVRYHFPGAVQNKNRTRSLVASVHSNFESWIKLNWELSRFNPSWFTSRKARKTRCFNSTLPSQKLGRDNDCNISIFDVSLTWCPTVIGHECLFYADSDA